MIRPLSTLLVAIQQRAGESLTLKRQTAALASAIAADGSEE